MSGALWEQGERGRVGAGWGPGERGRVGDR